MFTQIQCIFKKWRGDSINKSRSSIGSIERDSQVQRELSIDHLMVNLGKRSAFGGVVAIAGQSFQMLITIANLIVMSRLLEPEDFGLVALAATVTAFASIFTDLGLSTATIQRKDVDQNLLSALFFISIGFSIIVMLTVWAFAPVAAWFFDDKRLFWLIIAMAITIPISAAGSQHQALLSRQMRWLTIQGRALAAGFCGAALGIFLAWKFSLGYWALVASAWASAIVGLLFVWTALSWRPSRVTNWGDAKSAVNFGANLLGFNASNWLNRQADNMLIGWWWGAVELGYYTRAYSILNTPMSLISGPVSSAIVPALSRLQDHPDRWRLALLRSQSAVFLGVAGLATVLSTSSETLIQVLLGAKWNQAGEIFSILSLSLLATMISNSTGWIYVSLGNSRRMFIWGLSFSPFITCAFVIGLPYGSFGVATAFLAAQVIAVVPCVWFAAYKTPVKYYEILRTALMPVILSLIIVFIMSYSAILITELSIYIKLLMKICISGLLFLFGSVLILRFDSSYKLLRLSLSDLFYSMFYFLKFKDR